MNEENKECCDGVCDCVPKDISPIKLDKIIEIDSIKENSVVLFKVTQMSVGVTSTVKNFLQIYGEKLQDRNITLLIVSDKTDISVLDEDQMKSYGWIKAEQKRIITL